MYKMIDWYICRVCSTTKILLNAFSQSAKIDYHETTCKWIIASLFHSESSVYIYVLIKKVSYSFSENSYSRRQKCWEIMFIS